MPNLIMMTVGTSGIDNFLSSPEERQSKMAFLREIEGRPIPSEGDKYPESFRQLKDAITKKLIHSFTYFYKLPATLALADHAEGRVQLLSAEVMTLRALIGREPSVANTEDNVTLFYSDTMDGLLAAEINQEILTRSLGFTDVDRKRLTGIRGVDAAGFTSTERQEGLKSLFDNTRNAVNDGEHTLICFTGGYKALIPWLTGYAMQSRLDMFCLFEKANDVVRYAYSNGRGPETPAENVPIRCLV